VPLDPYAAAALRQWRTDQKAERLAHPAWTGWAHSCGRRLKPRQYVCPDCMLPAKPDLLVFAQPDGRPVDSTQDWEDWAAILREAGVDHYGIHTATRHQAATMMLESGVDIRVVQEVMRHASPDFTRRTYQHVRVKLRQDAVAELGRALRGR
jgi:integrase